MSPLWERGSRDFNCHIPPVWVEVMQWILFFAEQIYAISLKAWVSLFFLLKMLIDEELDVGHSTTSCLFYFSLWCHWVGINCTAFIPLTVGIQDFLCHCFDTRRFIDVTGILWGEHFYWSTALLETVLCVLLIQMSLGLRGIRWVGLPAHTQKTYCKHYVRTWDLGSW